mgnify:CR=1 FL=1
MYALASRLIFEKRSVKVVTVLYWKQKGDTKLTSLLQWTLGSLLLAHGYSYNVVEFSGYQFTNSSECVYGRLSHIMSLHA